MRQGRGNVFMYIFDRYLRKAMSDKGGYKFEIRLGNIFG